MLYAIALVLGVLVGMLFQLYLLRHSRRVVITDQDVDLALRCIVLEFDIPAIAREEVDKQMVAATRQVLFNEDPDYRQPGMRYGRCN